MSKKILHSLLVLIFFCSPSYADNSSHFYKLIPRFHSGVDIISNIGDPVYAYEDGVVYFVGNSNDGFGNKVILRHEQENTYSVYAHLQDIFLKENERVKEAQTIATIGKSGNADETAYLHFEIRKGNNYVNAKSVNPGDQFNFFDRVKQYFRGLFEPTHSKTIPKTEISK